MKKPFKPDFFTRLLASFDIIDDELKVFYHLVQFLNKKKLMGEFRRYLEKHLE